MDQEGYLPISLIASFHRVQALTQDVSLVIQALQQSPLLQLKDGVKVRTVNDAEKWPILPETLKGDEQPGVNVPQSAESDTAQSSVESSSTSQSTNSFNVEATEFQSMMKKTTFTMNSKFDILTLQLRHFRTFPSIYLTNQYLFG